MPHTDPVRSAAYKKAWANTPAGRSSLRAASERYRATTKGILREERRTQTRRGTRHE